LIQFTPSALQRFEFASIASIFPIGQGVHGFLREKKRTYIGVRWDDFRIDRMGWERLEITPPAAPGSMLPTDPSTLPFPVAGSFRDFLLIPARGNRRIGRERIVLSLRHSLTQYGVISLPIVSRE
jgi:hypothetical protein